MMNFKTLRVMIIESDFYARHAMNSYLAWDRRTRVKHLMSSMEQAYDTLSELPELEYPEAILLDAHLLSTPEAAYTHISRLMAICNPEIIIMTVTPDIEIAKVARRAGAKGYVLKEDVSLQISWMVVWAQDYDFIVTQRAAHLFPDAAVLPNGRDYPELTDRVRQALILCVVEGMSAELAADEMGLSPHTIRTYIKEGYSILEANDETEYPKELSPQERAFMRFTSLSITSINDKLSQDRSGRH
jgi:DNA-binding NarL/FixJ family response regulator